MEHEFSNLIDTSLTQAVFRLYTTQNTNCSETLLEACNEIYDLQLPEGSSRLFSVFGSGMYSGNVCGALSALSAVLSYQIVEDRAHTCEALRPAQLTLVRNFREILGDTQCPKCKMMHHTPEHRCLKTCLLAAKAMEKTIADLRQKELIDPADFTISR